MITIIFLDELNETVQLRFLRNEDLNNTHNYGIWKTATNDIELNDKGWEIFQKHRKDVRKLKPLIEQLKKI
ncbi:MAG TPA: hypothetical protein VF623_15405 [Segetibacter sp.]|jgi:hypothetical protein